MQQIFTLHKTRVVKKSFGISDSQKDSQKLLRYRSFWVHNTIWSFTRLFDSFNTFFHKDHNTIPFFHESPSKLFVYRIYTRVLI